MKALQNNMSILRVAAEKISGKEFNLRVVMADGRIFSSRTGNARYFDDLEKARVDKDEERAYQCLITIAETVLKENDVYYDEIEII